MSPWTVHLVALIIINFTVNTTIYLQVYTTSWCKVVASTVDLVIFLVDYEVHLIIPEYPAQYSNS